MEKKLIQRFPTFHRVVIFLLLLLLPSIHLFHLQWLRYSTAHLSSTAHHASSLSTRAVLPLLLGLTGCVVCLVLVFPSFLHPEIYIFIPQPLQSHFPNHDDISSSSSAAALSFSHFHLLMLFHVRLLSCPHSQSLHHSPAISETSRPTN